MNLEWSADALADLDRFAAFLDQHHPGLAGVVAREIVEKTKLPAERPHLGRPLTERREYRQLVLQVLNAAMCSNTSARRMAPRFYYVLNFPTLNRM